MEEVPFPPPFRGSPCPLSVMGILSLLQRNLVALLETSMNYLEKAERYEKMSEVLKLLQPFYDKNKDFKNMAEIYGKLHEAFKKVVDIMATGKRYLGTYFRIAFFGKVRWRAQGSVVSLIVMCTYVRMELYHENFITCCIIVTVLDLSSIPSLAIHPSH